MTRSELIHTGMREVLRSVEFADWDFLVRVDGDRPYLQVAATTPCNVTGDALPWRGRKWFLSEHMTRSELIQTAFKAVTTAMEHEVRERFLYRGQSIFDPHYDVDALHDLRSRGDCLDARPELSPDEENERRHPTGRFR